VAPRPLPVECQQGPGAGGTYPEDKSENYDRAGADSNTSRTPERLRLPSRVPGSGHASGQVRSAKLVAR
jgi:hypothetical protein